MTRACSAGWFVVMVAVCVLLGANGMQTGIGLVWLAWPASFSFLLKARLDITRFT